MFDPSKFAKKSSRHHVTVTKSQFVSACDIAGAISSPTARFTGAASDGDKKAIQARLKEREDVNIRDWEELNDLTVASSRFLEMAGQAFAKVEGRYQECI